MTSSTDSITRITRLLSDAQQFIRNADSGPEISREYWIEKAKDCAFEASLVAEDYKAPKQTLPEWGTYGT
jgi:hypothetical protein